MSQYKVKNYEGYQEILESVRSIVKGIAPEWAALSINKEIERPGDYDRRNVSGQSGYGRRGERE
tara:strand:+ start:283 stop:474 length:192 start_codon:yes stop_codon:yes gene_type:complete